ncbi:MAG TPA: radical SAM protein [Methanoregulaceae archaeon]|nr:radical SAM protein [Methanoregulaceae archaeon]
MITQVHFITTYMCTHTCDHCFVCSSPASEGTFTLSQIIRALDQAQALGTVDMIYFEGGEPFLFYPLLKEGIRHARLRGFAVGVVTNGYFATSDENARLFLEPLTELGIADFSISDDVFHYENRVDNPARRAFTIARDMGIAASVLALDSGASGPDTPGSPREEKTGIVTGGGIMFRGRAAGKLSRYASRNNWQQFTRCPYEDLVNPKRLHVDSFGNLQICQGITIGNIWERPLQELIDRYSAVRHPVCGPLVQGGPVQLARDLEFTPPADVADACHLCFLARKARIGMYPEILSPGQVYCNE